MRLKGIQIMVYISQFWHSYYKIKSLNYEKNIKNYKFQNTNLWQKLKWNKNLN